MESSSSEILVAIVDTPSMVRRRWGGRLACSHYEHKANEWNETGRIEANRYRTGSDADGKADSHDSAADTPDSAASIRADANGEANLNSCAASRTIDITKLL
jgi:hypothetical protein